MNGDRRRSHAHARLSGHQRRRRHHVVGSAVPRGPETSPTARRRLLGHLAGSAQGDHSAREGQRLWGSRFGNLSSLRIAQGAAPFDAADRSGCRGLQSRATSARMPWRRPQGTTDFGEYFLYFSFFLVVSALLLAYLFFALGLEQRSREVGLLSAVGFSPARIRGAFIREGAVLATVGALVGAAGSIGYARVHHVWPADLVGRRRRHDGAAAARRARMGPRRARRAHSARDCWRCGSGSARWSSDRRARCCWARLRSTPSAATRTAPAADRRARLPSPASLLVGAGTTRSHRRRPPRSSAPAPCALAAGLCASALVLRRHGGAGHSRQARVGRRAPRHDAGRDPAHAHRAQPLARSRSRASCWSASAHSARTRPAPPAPAATR